ncbi:xanthine dehydrogenase family protein molybdopterin-binding subunit [Ramlibacter tataouinensis]|uniref:Carbon monoxide dehydrogenase n=1 Tax=Ramlibacter tataouinensis TaxID=94132 RepID=A0A127JVB1_9BURK|nr:xanthine dehydrogenase family protein molybdopterin-binding subunit [Ramlibacter tataouinensis]AMO23946.1 carbon monoxide dehydrogenase [Ramlibacter tataouinensis]
MHFDPAIAADLHHVLSHRVTAADGAAPLERRSFLKLGAAGFALGVFPLRSSSQTADALKPTQQPAAFVQIERDGTTTVAVNRLEFGQGAHTGLAMVLAEELDADWTKVRARHGDASPAYVDPAFGMHLTGGSNSIHNSYMQYRELGARMRAMLVAAAAQQWNTEPRFLRTENGAVTGPGGRRATYGELADAAMKQPVPQKIRLKDPKQFRLIGKPTRRLDARAKSTGQQAFGIDVRLPGMLTAVVAHPPVYGAKVKTVDDGAAKAVRGVKAVLRVPTDRGGVGVAVLADGYWPARQGRDALKLEWDTSGVERVDTAQLLVQYRELARQPGGLKHFDADLSELDHAPNRITAEFAFPYLAHAPMEPLNCTVAFDGQKAELWMGTQMPGFDAASAASTLGVAPEAVKVNTQMAGGGFGRRAISTSDYVVEACQVAKAARAAGLNAPVRTLWSREDDIKGGYYRPMHVHRAQIGFDVEGNILAWDHVIVGQSILKGTPFEEYLVKDGIDSTAVEGMREPYAIPMRLTVHHPQVNVPVLWWRSVGSTHTAYVMETLLDEVARASKQDPVALRLKLMGGKHPRHAAALKLAVEKSGYGKRKLAPGHAWGVALHESFNTVVAYVAEASIEKGVPKLHHVTAGVHCNLPVNPLSIETQIQGAALMGLSTCLPGNAITLKDGVVEQNNFGEYRVARMPDMPLIAVHIVPSAEPPTGIGEPGLPPLAPAYANAIARLTGKNAPRELPFATV